MTTDAYYEKIQAALASEIAILEQCLEYLYSLHEIEQGDITTAIRLLCAEVGLRRFKMAENQRLKDSMETTQTP